MQYAGLSINLDPLIHWQHQVQRRHADRPLTAALLSELAGVEQVTVSIGNPALQSEQDLSLLAQSLQVKLNIALPPTQEYVRQALSVKPACVTLVSERREGQDPRSGLEVDVRRDELKEVINLLHDAEISTFLFVEPDFDQIKASHWAGADGVHVNTRTYSEARQTQSQIKAVHGIQECTEFANKKCHLGVTAGQGLNYQNIQALARISSIDTFDIGYGLFTRALLLGLDRAVRDMINLLRGV